MEKIIVKTPYTFERIQAYVSFTYDVRLAIVRNLSYILGVMFLLVAGSAVWCREWLYAVLLAIVGIILLATPTFVQKLNLHSILKELGDTKDSTVTVVFDDEAMSVTNADNTVDVPYADIKLAFESRNNFYIFANYNGMKNNLVICDKSQFQKGIPHDLRDLLIKKKGKKLKLKMRND